MNTFFQKLEPSLEVQTAKEKFLDNSGHTVLEPYNVLAQVRFAATYEWIPLSDEYRRNFTIATTNNK